MGYKVTTVFLTEVFETLEQACGRIAGFAGNNSYKPLNEAMKRKVEKGRPIRLQFGNLTVKLQRTNAGGAS